jgi:hypothetical protein
MGISTMSFSEPSPGQAQHISCYVTPLEATAGRHPLPFWSTDEGADD